MLQSRTSTDDESGADVTRTRIKMCGMTSARDVELAVEAGADAVGFILAKSARRVDRSDLPMLVRAVPRNIEPVVVVVDPYPDDVEAALELGCTLQFSGDESAETCESFTDGGSYIKAFHIDDESLVEDVESIGVDYTHARWMFDTRVPGQYGGTGISFPWALVAPAAKQRPIILSGGLRPDNVGACVTLVMPSMVDVRSGVESDGVKDVAKMRAFVDAVRAASALAPMEKR